MDRTITILDVLTRAAADPEFRTRFAEDPLDVARSAGLRPEDGALARYVEDRLEALARPADGEATRQQLADATGELQATFGLGDRAAATEAHRALLFWRDYRFHQRRLNHGEPAELEALIDSLGTHGPSTSTGRGRLLITLHYGPFPILWLWLKRAQRRGERPPFTLLYDTRLYTPDVSAGQYARLAAAGVVPESRRDLDLAGGALRPTFEEAVARLRAGEIVLMFGDAVPVDVRPGTLVCRVGRTEVAYPRGAVWLAQASESVVQGVAIRPTGGGHELWWGAPRGAPVTHEAVNAALQELLDASVGNDPAPWLAWFTEP
jgi:hypothetical protein